jgi:hypothetical protein
MPPKVAKANSYAAVAIAVAVVAANVVGIITLNFANRNTT